MMIIKRYISILLTFIIVLSVFPVISHVDDVSCGLNNFVKKNTLFSGTFNDVSEKDWFCENVKAVVEYGLMNGKSNSVFDQNGTLKMSEAITIVSRLHSIYNNKNKHCFN